MRAKYLGEGDRRDPKEISDVIGSIIEHANVDVDVRQGDLVAEWPAFAPGDWPTSVPIGVRDGSLLVHVADGASASLLQYQTTELLEAIRTRYGDGLVTGVRIRVNRTASPDFPSQ